MLSITAENVDRELVEEDMERAAVFFVTGEFIEKMYVLTQVIKRYPTDLPRDARAQLLRHLMMAVADQEEQLDSLIELLEYVRKENEGEKFMNAMNELKVIYAEANFREMIANWTPDFVPTGDYIGKITTQIETLRGQIVSFEQKD